MSARHRLYISAVAVLALVSLVISWRIDPLTLDEVPAGLVLALLVALSASSIDGDADESVGLSFTAVALMAAIPLTGPVGAGLIAAVAPAFDSPHRWRWPHLFNTAMLTLVATLGGIVYLWVGGAHPPPTTGSPLEFTRVLGIPLLIANVVAGAANIALLAGIMAAGRAPVRLLLAGMVAETIPLYLGYALLSFFLVVLWVPADAGPLAALLIVAPLFVAQWTYRQYGDERRSRSAIVRSLITAAGRDGDVHAEATVALARSMGRALGLGVGAYGDLDLAVRLREIGRLGVASPAGQLSTSVAGELSSGASGDVSDEIATATAVLAPLDFCAGALPILREQYERWDGSGAPRGSAGEQIPLGARVIALAAGAVAATDPDGRVDLERVRGGSGTAYDPSLVATLPRALEDPEWKAAAIALRLGPESAPGHSSAALFPDAVSPAFSLGDSTLAADEFLPGSGIS